MNTTQNSIVLAALVLALTQAHAPLGAQAEQPRGGTVQTTQSNTEKRRLSPDDVRKVAPALEAYTQERLYGEVWKRPGLSLRDRTLVTIAALIARDQSPALTYYFNQAIENGVKPGEISETITHLAFYAGWANAFGAVGAARDVFAARGIGTDQIAAVSVPRLALDEEAEAARAKGVGEEFGTAAPGVVQYTTDVLFREPKRHFAFNGACKRWSDGERHGRRRRPSGRCSSDLLGRWPDPSLEDENAGTRRRGAVGLGACAWMHGHAQRARPHAGRADDGEAHSAGV